MSSVPLGSQPRRYVLSVGTIEPRKNHVRLLAAFERLSDARAGSATRPRRVRGAGDRGRFVARLRGAPYASAWSWPATSRMAKLAALLRSCAVMAYPSTYEGFGFPVLEAMAAGVPVVTSATSSLPEVAGGAAVLVDPLDVGSIGDGLVEAMRRRECVDRRGSVTGRRAYVARRRAGHARRLCHGRTDRYMMETVDSLDEVESLDAGRPPDVVRRAAGDAIWNAAALALPGIANVLILAYLLRTLGAAGFAPWATALALLGLLTVLDAGLGATTARNAARAIAGDLEASALVRAAYVAYGGLAVLVLILGLSLSPVAARLLGLQGAAATDATVVAMILALDVAIVVGTTGWLGTLRGARRFDLAFAASAGQVVVGVPATLILVPSFGLVGAAVAQVLGRICGRTIAAIGRPSRGPAVSHPRRQGLRGCVASRRRVRLADPGDGDRDPGRDRHRPDHRGCDQWGRGRWAVRGWQRVRALRRPLPPAHRWGPPAVIHRDRIRTARVDPAGGPTLRSTCRWLRHHRVRDTGGVGDGRARDVDRSGRPA